MTAININELMSALKAEQEARSTLDAIGLEFQKIHRAEGKPSPQQIEALRTAAAELVTAGQTVLEIIDRPPPDATGSP
jgi:hypothetical protein